jgi:hypothetical protein
MECSFRAQQGVSMTRSEAIEQAARALVDEVDEARANYLRQFPPKTGTEWHLIARDHPSIKVLRSALAASESTASPYCGAQIMWSDGEGGGSAWCIQPPGHEGPCHRAARQESK